MINRPLKYLGYGITLQEVPNEISLFINISGCPHKCEGCHSDYLWEYEGKYIGDDLLKILSEYYGLITCVCFMGGEQNIYELYDYLFYIKSLRLKTCLYSGCDSIDDVKEIIPYLDYLKIGKYDNSKIVDDYISNGVKLATSNQEFIIIRHP